MREGGAQVGTGGTEEGKGEARMRNARYGDEEGTAEAVLTGVYLYGITEKCGWCN